MISKLRCERLNQELSQYELALKTGIPQWRISLIERGVRATVKERETLSKSLSTSNVELFFDDVEYRKNILREYIDYLERIYPKEKCCEAVNALKTRLRALES